MRKTLLYKRVATTFFTLLLANFSSAQVIIVKGVVKGNPDPLPSTTVSIGNKTVLTNDAGEFSISILPGTYKLTITHVGYKKIEQSISVNPDQIQSLDFNMTKNELMGEVVVLGSRSAIQRSNLNSAVPVDALLSKDLLHTGQPSLIQMLNFAVPSFNTSRQNLFEPVTLRGLGPDHLLILMNGTRYHSPAVLNQGSIRGTLGRGGVGNDLNSIPFSAIEKIEILRDGASAQYGSDAIAGVMNIELKKTTGKTFINLHLGQQYKGDGENMVFGINRGISLSKKGFLNFSGDFRYRNPTHRSGEYLGTVYKNLPPAGSTRQDTLRIIAMDDSIKSARNFSRKTPVSNDGSIELSSGGVLINGGYLTNNKIELYWTGAVNYRQPVYPGAYRFPKNTNQVNTALYPDGFKVKIYTPSWDVSGIAGARSETNKGWHWEFSSAYGNSSSLFNVTNTNNASQQFAMGKNAPTKFYSGGLFFSQQTNTISFAKDFAKKINGIKTFNLGFGGESRLENYRIKKGEDASWNNYDTTNKTQGGSQGFSGFSDSNAVKANRNVIGMYVDLEVDFNDHLLIDIASRYEYYGDFGNNLTGKLAMRYKLSSAFSIRGSLSNGYHAPALQQIYYSSTVPAWKNTGGVNVPVRLGTFSTNSVVAQAFGLKPLQPEKAMNLSGGFTSTISRHIGLTVDAYWIQIKNRIVLSGRFDKTNPDVNRILQNLPGIDQVQFFTNAINTRTCGIDIVMNGNWMIRKANLGFMLAANFTRTNIFGPIQTTDKLSADSLNTNTLFNREERKKIENGQPGSKIILSANYKRGKMEFLIRSTRFGKTSAVFNSANKSQDEFFSAKILTDFSITYSPKTWLTITAGANNIFDVYPDRLKNYVNTTEGILIYGNEAMPFGYNGGYYYINMAFSL